MFCFRGLCATWPCTSACHEFVNYLWPKPSNPIQVRGTRIHLSYTCLYRIGETDTSFSRRTKSRYTPIITSFKQAKNGGKCLAPTTWEVEAGGGVSKDSLGSIWGWRGDWMTRDFASKKQNKTTTKVVSKTKSQRQSSYQQLSIRPECEWTGITTCDLQLSQTPADTM